MSISLKVNKRVDRVSVIGRRASNAVSEILADNAQAMASIARQLVAVDTGFLKSTIAVEQEGKLKFRIIAGAFYAAYVEFGTAHQIAQPFLTPAVEFGRKELVRELRQLEFRLR